MPIGDAPLRTRVGPQGWECPKCGAVYAPWVASCTECKPPAPGERERITEAQPPAPMLPVVPYAPAPVYPLFPASQWPYGQVVWCDSVTPPAADYTLTLTPEARARMTACSGADHSYTQTVTLAGAGTEPQRDEGDDGAAGVPARI